MHNQELESVDAVKYLGVTISKDQSWSTHINNITSIAYKTLGFNLGWRFGTSKMHLSPPVD